VNWWSEGQDGGNPVRFGKAEQLVTNTGDTEHQAG
jgi:hypothetical protein